MSSSQSSSDYGLVEEALFGEPALQLRKRLLLAIEAGEDFGAQSGLVFRRLKELRKEGLEIALRLLDAHPPSPESWDAFIDSLSDDLGTSTPGPRRWAAEALLNVMGGRIGARYLVSRKPSLERPRLWSVLLACCEHKDKVLRESIVGGLYQSLGGADDLVGLLPKLITLVDGNARGLVLRSLEAAVLRGLDVSCVRDELNAITTTTVHVLDALGQGRLASALGLHRTTSLSEQAATLSRLSQAEWEDMASAIRFITEELKHPDPCVRVAAVHACERLTRTHDVSIAIEALAALLADGAKPPKASALGLYAGVALGAIAFSGSLAAQEPLTRGLSAKAVEASHAAWGLATLAMLAHRVSALSELASHAKANVRTAVFQAIASKTSQQPVQFLQELLDVVDESRDEPNKLARKARHTAHGKIVESARFTPGGSELLYRFARRVWKEAIAVGVYDDPASIHNIVSLLQNSLRNDPAHIPSLELLSELFMELKDAREARPLVLQLQALEPGSREHQRKMELLDAGDLAALQDYVEQERLGSVPAKA